MVKVEFMAELAALADAAQIDLPGGETVLCVLSAASDQLSPGLKKRLFLADGSFTDDVFILVNGQHARYLEGLQTRIKAGDTITLIPFIEGG